MGIIVDMSVIGATAPGNTWANPRHTFGHRDRNQRGRHYMGGVAISLAGLALSGARNWVFRPLA